ncbi:hypothetical protein GN244_ATG10559 [Phytophthora infestans]|uniref:Transmembrane protein n=1 Tax=Phytophthora infestans TaxID=4787 RepID=A0A833TAB3_PHYIN|nr:hypothetical protein GN244_ATG10559 [Phytophthora infestans]
MASSNSSGLEQEVTAPTNVSTSGDSCTCISEQIAGEAYYLASSSSYCDFSDEICTTCRSRWQEEYAAKGGDKSSTVCIGQNGCPSFEKAKVGSIMLVIAMGVASLIIFSMFIFCIKKLLKRALPWPEQLPPDPSVLSRGRPQRPPRGPQLSLSGWKSMLVSEGGHVISDYRRRRRLSPWIA